MRIAMAAMPSSGSLRISSFYNAGRLHQALDYRTPDEAYFGTYAMAVAA